MILDFRQLRNFVKVVELKSLSRAAEQIGIGQPALGMQIRSLEDEFHHALINRHSRGIEPTEAGVVLLGYARRMLSLCDEALLRLSDMHQLQGQVGVGISVGGSRAAHQLVRLARERLPLIPLVVMNDPTPRLIEKLKAGDIDLAIVQDPAPDEKVTCDKLYEDELCMITSADAGVMGGSIRFGELANWEFIASEPLRVGGKLLPMKMLARSEEFVMDVVRRGLAATIAPRSLMSNDGISAGLIARPIVEPGIRTSIHIAYRADGRPSKSCEAVLSLILETSDSDDRISVI